MMSAIKSQRSSPILLRALMLLALLLPWSAPYMPLSVAANARSRPEHISSPERMRADSAIDAAVERFIASPGVDSTALAFIVRDLATGKVVASYYPARPLIPASILKSVTVASLLREEGEKRTFRTPVFYDGQIDKGVLRGNLVVAGSGDPSINSTAEPRTPDFPQEIAEALTRLGVDSVAGKIVVDNSLFAGDATPPSWAAGDLGKSYGTGSHAFNFENNSRGKASVKDPSVTFRSHLSTALTRAGIRLGNNDIKTSRRHTLTEHISAPYAEIMRSCMMRSDNLFAEALLRTFGVARGLDGSTPSAAADELRFWRKRKAPVAGIEIIDGSGLSRSNRMTVNFIDHVLNDMSENVEYASFFPLAGQEGTLRKFMKDTPLDSYAALKTGSMNGIQCYAGYLLDEDFAPTHSVVVIANKLRNRSRMRDDFGNLLLNIFQNQ